MKVLLINPMQKNSMYSAAPLGLLYLASVLLNNGHKVKILDLTVDNEDIFDVVESFIPDVIGLTCMTCTYMEAERIAKTLKEFYDARIIVGGAHITAVGAESIIGSTNVFDVVVQGEAELVINDVVEGKLNGAVIAELPVNLDSLPFPAWHLVDASKYKTLTTSKKFATLVTSRGCPYDCIFCDSNKNFRARSAENVIAEIKYLKDIFKINQFILYDDNFAVDKQRVLKICDLLRDLNIKFKCETRVNLVDGELLVALKIAGCNLISYGIECGYQKGLDFLNKHTTIQMIVDAIRKTQLAHIDILGYFILGLPEETEFEALSTIDFAIQLDLLYAQFSILTALPGTSLHKYAKENDLLINESGSYVGSQSDVSLKNKHMTSKKLKQLKRLANKRFYLRFSYVVKRLRMIRGFEDIKLLARAAKEVLG